MKPFAVIKFKSDPAGFHFARNGANRDMRIAYSGGQATCHGGELTLEQDVYYVDSPDDANALGDILSTRYPHFTWLVCKTEVVLYREPGKLNKAAFTDKGLMPA